MIYNDRRQHVPEPPPLAPYEGPSPLPLACPPGDDYAKELFSLLESVGAMKKHGYVMGPLSEADIKMKRRCNSCNQTISALTKGLHRKLQHRLENPIPPQPQEAYRPLPTIVIPAENGLHETIHCTVPCNYHRGTYTHNTRSFPCCNGKSGSRGCVTVDSHTLRNYEPGELERYYQFHGTPLSHCSRKQSIRAAVAIDCEMGTAITGDTELIRLSAIDYLTGEVLINNLVQPDQQMLHLNTKYSGVTFPQLNEARRKRACLIGKAGAREALWRFVGPHTALVGHGVHNDLRALRWVHPTVVDSYMIEYKIVQARKEREAKAAALVAAAAAEKAELRHQELAQNPELAASVASPDMLELEEEEEGAGDKTNVEPKKKRAKGTGELALKTMLKKYLDRDIQMKGNKGHDSFEDALAARDLVHWMVMRRLVVKQGLAV